MTTPKGPLIWIVEDDPSAQRLIAESLRFNGFSTVVFSSAEKAYAAMRVDPLPDLIVLDMLLPGMSGVDLIRLVKQDKTWSEIPVVVVTVLSRTQAFGNESAIETNPVYWVRKPFEVDHLMRVVQEILSSVGI